MSDSLIHVLAVDDEVDFSLLTKSFLETSKAMEVDTVCSAKEAMAELNKKCYDVIVSDYQMPEVDGIQFLKSLRAAGDGTPFILFTGKGREEVVIEALNNGADSYVQKGGRSVPQYAELEHRINVVVQRRRAKEALLRSERRFKDFFEATKSGVAIYLVRNNGESGDDYIIQDFNSKALEMEGKSKDEVIGRSLRDLRPNIDIYGLIPIFRQVWQTGESAFFPSKAYVDEHYSNWYENTVFRLPSGEIVAIYDDVTDRKTVEEALKESEARFELLAEHGGTVIWETDADGLYTYASRMSEAVWGYRPDELVGKKHFYDLTPEAERDSLKTSALEVFKSKGKFSGLENHIRTKEGRVIWVSTSGLPLLNADGTLRGYQGSDIDITERKNAEEKLLENQEKYNALYNRLIDLVYVHDFEGNFLDANPATLELLGYSAEEVTRLNFASLLDPAQLPSALEAANEIKTTGSQKNFTQYRLRTKKGEYVDIETAGSIIFDHGRPFAIQGVGRDISERKKAEKEMLAAKKTMADVIDFLPDATFVVDLEGRVVAWNHAIEKMSGVRKDNMIGQGDRAYSVPFYGSRRGQLIDLLTVDDEQIKRNYDYVTRKGDTLYAEAFCNALNGGRGAYVWAIATSIFDDKGNRIGAIESIRDITERKLAEQALKESVQRYELVMDGSSAGLWDSDVINKRIHFSPHWKAMRGYADDEIGESEDEWISRIHPEDAPRIIAALHSHFNGQTDVYEAEYRVRRKDGSYIWVLDRGKAIRDASGKVIRNAGSEIDITERKRVEAALRESEARVRAYVDNSPEGIFIVDGMGNYLDVNKTACSMLNYSREELLNLNIASITDKSALEDSLNGFQQLKEKHAMSMETILMKKDGVGLPIFLNAVELPNKTYMAFCTDITERKKIEDALQESVQRYELVMAGSSAGLWDWDVLNHRIHYSSRWKGMRGYTDAEIGDSEMEWSSRVHPDDEMRVMAALQAHFDGLTDVYQEEYRILCKDGSIKWILDRGKAVRDANGQVIRAAGSETDITERKLAEQAIKKSEALYRLLADNSTDVIGIVDPTGAYTYVSPSVLQLRGYTPEEVIRQTLEEIVSEESVPIVQKAIRHNFEMVDQGIIPPTLVFEVEQLCKDGSTVWVEAITNELFDGNGNHVGSSVVCRNISKRKRAEDALRLANAKLGILNNVTRHDINNQMTVLNGFLDLCKMREKDPDMVRYLEKMSLAAANVHQQIAFTKDYQELGIKAPAWASVGRRIASAFAMLHPPEVVLEDQTEGIEVLTDPLADKVHYNLIDNSMRHGGHVTRIRVSSEQVGDDMLIVYEDDGVGISLEDKRRLFEKGFGKNTGYGLFLIREILAITGITIEEKGQPGRGVRFEMKVPSGAWRRASAKVE